MRNDLPQPSYQQGFASCAAESEYPELWKRLVGAWVPEMGCTGNTMRDLSLQKAHASITPGKWNWQIRGGGLCLCPFAYTGYGTTSNHPSHSFSDNHLTIHVWSRLAFGLKGFSITKNNEWQLVGDGTPRFRFLMYDNGGTDYTNAVLIVNKPVSNAGIEHAITLIKSGPAVNTDTRVFANGSPGTVYNAGSLTSASMAPTTNPVYLGASVNAGAISGVLLWAGIVADPLIRLLHDDPIAPFRLRRRVYAAAVASTSNRRRRVLCCS